MPRLKPSLRPRGRLLALLATAGALVALAGPAAAQGERISAYDVDIQIRPDGSLLVTESVAYDFDGATDRHGVYRDIPTRIPYPPKQGFDRVYRLTGVAVSGSPGTPDDVKIQDVGNGYTRIRIGDPDRTVAGQHTYTISYRIEGALNGFPDHDELYWNAIGTDWTVPIERATVRVTAPTDIPRVACFVGPYGSSLPCGESGVEGNDASFPAVALGPHEGYTVVIGLPKGAVPEPKPILREQWTASKAFFGSKPLIGVASVLLLAVVIGFGMLAWRTGRDRRWVGSPIDAVMGPAGPGGAEEQAVPLGEEGEGPVEFAPPEGLRPGQIGTVIDEQANPLDVTATIVDLAVRGHLKIIEIPKHGWFGKPDWMLERTRNDTDPLLGYEATLLAGLFEDGDAVKLSELKTKFVERLKRVNEALYDDAVQRGWFSGQPYKVRTSWELRGAMVLVVGAVLEYIALKWHTGLALLPVPLVAAGLLGVVGSRWMPRRTPKGTAMVRRIRGFRRVIEAAETNMSRWAEQENVFTRFLPYAVVFGCTDKWARAFAGLAAQPPDTSTWYVSPNPFNFEGFSNAIDGFTVTTAGTIASTPSGSGSSGFGGGGSSGGGGGGGGGGSW